MNINKMTRAEFEALPNIEKCNGVVESFILLPNTQIHHDSGYRCFNAIAIDKEGEILGKCRSYDVLNLEAIRFMTIDCLKKSKLFRVWLRRPYKMTFDTLWVNGERDEL